MDSNHRQQHSARLSYWGQIIKTVDRYPGIPQTARYIC